MKKIAEFIPFLILKFSAWLCDTAEFDKQAQEVIDNLLNDFTDAKVN
jgi:hypothetical protein